MADTSFADPLSRQKHVPGAKRVDDDTDDLPLLPPRFLEPPGLIWGSFAALDDARLRWSHLPAASPRAECVMVGGFTECIEKYFETMADLAARGLSVWCLDWRGQGGSARPKRLPSRPRTRRFDRDAADLAAFAEKVTTAQLPRLLIGHSMGGATALLVLHRYPGLFDAAILSAPMLGIRTGGVPPALMRCLTRLARGIGLGICFLPGRRRWSLDRTPTPELSRVSNDPERCRLQYAWFSADTTLRVGAPTWGWLDGALRLTARLAKGKLLAGIDTPILLASAGVETFLRLEAHRRAGRLLPECTLVEFPDSKHEPFLERDAVREPWFAAIDRFVAEHLRQGNRL